MVLQKIIFKWFYLQTLIFYRNPAVCIVSPLGRRSGTYGWMFQFGTAVMDD